MMERESAQLDREVKLAERSYGADNLLLVVARGYLAKLLTNARVVRHISQQRPEFPLIPENCGDRQHGRLRGSVAVSSILGTRTRKRGDRRRRRTVGRIKRGGGDGGEPVWGPPGRRQYRRPTGSPSLASRCERGRVGGRSVVARRLARPHLLDARSERSYTETTKAAGRRIAPPAGRIPSLCSP